jgi:hypothetical protein
MVHSCINSTKGNFNIPAVTQASILHNSDGYIRDGQQNSLTILPFKHCLKHFHMYAVQYNGHIILHLNYVLPPSVTSLPPDCISTEWSRYPATKNMGPR